MRVRKVIVEYHGNTLEFDSESEALEFSQRLLYEEGVIASIRYE